MATHWHDGLAMVAACDQHKVGLFVVKQNRHNPIVRLLKQALQAGRFGKLYHVNCNVYWTRPQAYYEEAKWRGTWEFDGGALLNQASHYADLLQWLVGPIHSVQAMMATLGRNIETEDTAVLNVRWRAGAIGSMNITMLTYPKNLEASMTILGEKGTVKIGGVAMNSIEHWEFADQNTDDALLTQASLETTAAVGSGHPRYYENIIQVFRGHAQAKTDGREGLKSLEFMTAAYRSARDNVTITLPLEL
jgi:UDP-N-acetyl-2-amino-2-deoxyglucuronate dehydrogenase